jgi:hypothetical protein
MYESRGSNIASVLVTDTEAVKALIFGFLDQVKGFLSGFLWTVTAGVCVGLSAA